MRVPARAARAAVRVQRRDDDDLRARRRAGRDEPPRDRHRPRARSRGCSRRRARGAPPPASPRTTGRIARPSTLWPIGSTARRRARSRTYTHTLAGRREVQRRLARMKIRDSQRLPSLAALALPRLRRAAARSSGGADGERRRRRRPFVVLVTDINQLNDHGFNQLAYQGLEARREAARDPRRRLPVGLGAGVHPEPLDRRAQERRPRRRGRLRPGGRGREGREAVPEDALRDHRRRPARPRRQAEERRGPHLPRAGGRLPRRLPRRASSRRRAAARTRSARSAARSSRRSTATSRATRPARARPTRR